MITQNVTIQPMYGCPVAEVKNSIRHHRINTDLARREIIEALIKETNIVQLHDFGSVVGEIIAKYSLKVNTPDEIDDFVDSYSHGVSLATGTHDRNEENEFVYVKKCYIKDLQREYNKMGRIVVFEAVIIAFCAIAIAIL